MPRVDTRSIAKGDQHLSNRFHECGVFAAWQIRAADGPGKESVAHEQVRSGARVPHRSAFGA